MGPPQKQLKTYPLHNNPNSADFSPDKQLVAIECTTQAVSADPKKSLYSEAVQIWNFKEDRLVAEFVLGKAEADATPKQTIRNIIRGRRLVRFSPDGKTVVALVDRRIFVLSASDLKEMISFDVAPQASFTGMYRGRPLDSETVVRSVEFSPKGDVLAVFWTAVYLKAEVALYELASGKPVRGWDNWEPWIYDASGLAWTDDGKTIVFRLLSSFPCRPPTEEPDLIAIDAGTGRVLKKITSGLLVGDIAPIPGDQLLAVDKDCAGTFIDRNPNLKVFDLNSGKRVREVSGRGAGIRYSVAASADGRRFVAFTGIIKPVFDWLDMQSWERTVDETFSVWSLSDYHGIVTSQNIPGLRLSELRISSEGRYVLSYGRANFIYELP